MKVVRFLSLLFLLTAVLLGWHLGQKGTVQAYTFTVDSTMDEIDAYPGDGLCQTATGTCSLRAAVHETTALRGTDTIVIPDGTYDLTIPPGTVAGLSASGSLEIVDHLTLLGDGAADTVLSGAFQTRILSPRCYLQPYPGTTSTPSNYPVVTSTPSNYPYPLGERQPTKSLDECIVPNVIVKDLTLRNGWVSPTLPGGAIFAEKARLTLENVWLTQNEPSGIVVYDGEFVMRHSIIQHSGQAIEVSNGLMQLENVSISQNDSAILLRNQSEAIIASSTLYDNKHYGILGRPRSFVRLLNSIIANHGWGNCEQRTLQVESAGYNLEDGESCGLNRATDLENQGPLLRQWWLVAGQTAVYLPLPNSPVIDAGQPVDCPLVDLRGEERPFDGDEDGTAVCDIGAVEYRGEQLIQHFAPISKRR